MPFYFFVKIINQSLKNDLILVTSRGFKDSYGYLFVMHKAKFRAITLLSDIIILVLSFLIVASFKPSGLKSYFSSHGIFFIFFVLIWMLVSLLNGKMHRGRIINFSTVFGKVLSSNLISLALVTLIMYIFRDYEYSRTVVLGTALVATFFELLLGFSYVAYKRAKSQDPDEFRSIRKPSEYELVGNMNGNTNGGSNGSNEGIKASVNPEIIEAIESEAGPEIAEAIIKMTGSKLTDKTVVLSTTTRFNISNLPEKKYKYLINLRKINDIKNLDYFIETVNWKLDTGGYFFCCVETKDQRKKRLLKKYPPVINYTFYLFDFIFKRVIPKLKFTRNFYFYLGGGRSAVISRAEALGRLGRGGFKIKQEFFIGHQLCIEAMKISDPLPKNGTFYGPIITLSRIGLGGEMIKVYKLRTMHPYSEYIQDYVYTLYDLQDGGKFKNDFRITSWGSVCRKIWLDEFPTFINMAKGNMKLVGVRPLSRHYFDLYQEEVRQRRIKYKPGLIPPFYADMPSDLESIQASEMKYMDSYDKNPFLTDFRYFWKSWWNILFKHARSK